MHATTHKAEQLSKCTQQDKQRCTLLFNFARSGVADEPSNTVPLKGKFALTRVYVVLEFTETSVRIRMGMQRAWHVFMRAGPTAMWTRARADQRHVQQSSWAYTMHHRIGQGGARRTGCMHRSMAIVLALNNACHQF